jgi:uncharacterized peroxidase-related enzyme
MSRIHPSVHHDEQVKTILNGMQQTMGFIPNIFQLMSNSKAVLGGFLSLAKSLDAGKLSKKQREAIALCVAGYNRCAYCTKAHSVGAKKQHVEADEIAHNLKAASLDPKTDQLLKYVQAVLKTHGAVAEEAVKVMKKEGFDDEMLVEIHANIGLNIFTNYFNNTFLPEIDF